ncbi:NAD(P)-dependent dehydrogenase (short-subunit alcohol dehydrogenase family) [Loktanella sp. PT4BL]|jgi:NAD(P)-dependent dehydrogenase (short-subunit alcohol dehydrogenase family)|uniref:SDR family oxidoreductase n=1 Tax=Loktanella sp. PT4BL TaxID=2135611 RepID=UPI000D751EE0|nr:SDR family oxidoreductase [Loktanella sp. PT4BL]PXW72161.1 NAD(P)-dependent dehydrogenase (short-subunit alcohol dehydrogenase family) [Loktanella sp. PT4BL]
MSQRVFITAGAGGIGKVIAETYAAQGAQVFVCDQDRTAIDNLAEEINGTCVDVTDEAALDAWLQDGITRFGGCDVLINNAGIAGQADPVEALDLAQWRTCLAVNLDAQMITCRAIAPVMKRQKSGVIINLSSTSGLFGAPFRAPYAAAKWAVIGFTKTIATELGPYGIRCNAICPGAVSGDRMDRVLAAEAQARGVTPQDVYQEYASGSSLRRFAEPAEIAQLCLYLSSDAAKFISGQAIAVDGNTETYHSV